MQVGASMSTGVAGKCACRAGWERWAVKGWGESAVNLAELLRLLFCLFREVQQSSLPPALPVADVT